MKQASLCEGAISPFGLVGDSPELKHVLQVIQKLSNNRWPVLLVGESGTGKELVAKALHTVSPGPRGVFVPVDCAALPPTLIESELFGHVRGSFTGATAARRGLICEAHGGTLFLDEVGELPQNLQPKLLRTIQEKEIRPVGGACMVRVDIRLIAATNRDLKTEVREGRFRPDLFYRLQVITLRLPSLRERYQDIPLLVHHFLRLYAPTAMTVTRRAMGRLMEYNWPGNVRELENCILGLAALALGTEITEDDLPTDLSGMQREIPSDGVVLPPRIVPLAELEELALKHALRVTCGDRCKAAAMLGIGKTTLYRKLKVLGATAIKRSSTGGIGSA